MTPTVIIRRNRKGIPEELVDKIIQLAPQVCADEIAQECRLPITTVYHVLRRAGVASKPRKADPWKNRRDEGGQVPTGFKLLRDPKPPPMPITPMEAAREAFVNGPLMQGKPPRLVITSDRMTLDGRNIGLNELMRKTNAMRVAWGLEQIVTNPVWRV